MSCSNSLLRERMRNFVAERPRNTVPVLDSDKVNPILSINEDFHLHSAGF